MIGFETNKECRNGLQTDWTTYRVPLQPLQRQIETLLARLVGIRVPGAASGLVA
jgi:hypothetical protein